MSFIAQIKSWLGSDQGAGPRDAGRLYILDAAGLSNGRGRSSRPAPSENIQLLQRLSRLAKKEQLKLYAVLQGKELREVSHGGDFSGVSVYFAERAGVSDLVLKLFKGARRLHVTVITSDKELEERVHGLGGDTMRTTTFRKVMDSGGGGSERNASASRRRPRRKSRPSDNKPKPQAEAKPQDPVSELIDLVE